QRPEHAVRRAGEIADAEEPDRRPDSGLAAELEPAFAQLLEERSRLDRVRARGRQPDQEQRDRHDRRGVEEQGRARAAEDEQHAAERRSDHAEDRPAEADERVRLLEAYGAHDRRDQALADAGMTQPSAAP